MARFVSRETVVLAVEQDPADDNHARSKIVFTNKRLMLVDKQGVTSSKTEYQSIPYARIVRFSKESAGIMDLDAELKIWIVGQPLPITKTFGKNENVNEVYQILSRAVLD